MLCNFQSQAASRRGSNKRSMRLDKLFEEHQAAVTFEIDVEVPEGEPGRARYEGAVKASEAAYQKLSVVRNRAIKRGVKSWGDLAVLAELARAHDVEGSLDRIGGNLVVLGALYDGALHMSETLFGDEVSNAKVRRLAEASFGRFSRGRADARSASVPRGAFCGTWSEAK
jgi:hypothetical protein